MKKNCKAKLFCGLSVMRGALCGLLLLSLATLFTHSPVYGQQNVKRISLKLEATSLLEALREINRLSDNVVVFKKEEVERESKRVTVDLKNVTVKAAVEVCVEGTGLTCMDFERKIVVTPRKQPTSITIAGIVRDSDGGVLLGATVVVKGDSLLLGTSAGADGSYRLMVPTSATTLIFSFVGYKPKEVTIGGRTKIDVVLEEDVKDVDEVVVTGIFTRKASSYTGAVVTMTAKDIMRAGNQNLFQSLKNLDPSLFIMDNLEMGSNPNAIPEMKMRGISSFPLEETGVRLKGNYKNSPNQPLFMLDGFEVTAERVMDMDMNRIESVTLLKDASAKAIYGSKAANGVVVITTKRLAGNEQRVTYTGSVDIQMPDLSSYNLCNAEEKLEAERIDGIYDDANFLLYTQKQMLYQQRKQLVAAGLNTYWLSKPLRTGVGHKHNLSVELGDAETLRVVMSVSYNQVIGVMKGSDRRNISGSLDLSYRRNDLIFNNTMTVNSNKSYDSPYGTFSDYAKMNPYWRAKDPETGQVVRWAEDRIPNPMYDAEIGTLKQESYSDFLNNFQVEWRLWNSLILRGRVMLSFKRNNGDEFLPAAHSSFASITKDSPVEEQLRKGSYRLDNGKSSNVSVDLHGNYATAIGKHSILAMGGFGISEYSYEAYVHRAEGFPNSQSADITFARQYALDSRPEGASSLRREINFVLGGGYSYDDRYFVDFNVQTSASSLYGNDNRWATGWSVGIGWNLHNEHFFPWKDLVRQFKVRGSIGLTGNQNFDTNEAVATYEYYTNANYLGMTGSYLGRLANPALKWEQKKDYNVGVDATIHRATLRFDLYRADTENMLTGVSVPTSTGFTTVKDNLGLVRNSGIEAYLSYGVLQQNRTFLTIFGSLVTTKNKIIRLSESMRSFNELRDKMASDKGNNRPVLKYVDGESMETIWAVRSAGIDPMTGQELYIRQDGSLTYTYYESDLYPVGNSLPKYRGNFGFTFEHNGFGISTTFRYQAGYQYYNKTLIDRVENVDMNYNVDKRALYGRWKEPGQVTPFKRLGSFQYDGDPLAHQEMTRATSRFVQDAKEVTWGTLNVYYDLQPDLLKHLRMKQLRVSCYMEEIAKISSIKAERGFDYPFARTISFSLIGTF